MFIRNNEGFTLLELTVVIVILGLLAAIGIPKYKDHVREAELAHIKADMTIISKMIEVVNMDSPEAYKEYTGLDATDDDIAKLNTAVDEGRAFKEGDFLREYVGGKDGFNLVKGDFVDMRSKSELSGTFLINTNDELYFIADKLEGGIEEDNDEYLASDEGFEWVEDIHGYMATNETKKGYYKYIGNETEIEIPHTINGHPMTSYYMMFTGNEDTKKVISTNKNIKSMSNMFEFNNVDSLDVSDIYSENCTDFQALFLSSTIDKLIGLEVFSTKSGEDMESMFEKVETKHNINVINFDTSNVYDMRSMFKGNNSTFIDLGNFDTSNVHWMESMFEDSRIVGVLDISKFNTQKVFDMSSMFKNLKVSDIVMSEKFVTDENKDFNQMFSGTIMDTIDVSNFNTLKAKNLNSMFRNSNVSNIIGLENFENGPELRYLSNMFLDSPNLKEVDISGIIIGKYSIIEREEAGRILSPNITKVHLNSCKEIGWHFRTVNMIPDEETLKRTYKHHHSCSYY